MRLDWDDKGDGGIGWDEWKVWHYIEETKQDFDRGDLIALITKLPNILTVPDEIGMDVDNQGRLWVVYRANDGAIWLSRSTDEYNAWEHHERLIYVPSGSRNPTIAIDDDNEYTLAMEFVPAGSEESEIWLYEPPYSGNGIKKIADGSRPLIAKNFYGDLYLFYSKDQIVYRTRKDNYFEELNLLLPYEGNKPLGFRTIIDKQSFNFWVFKHIIFVGNGVSLPNYVLTNETHLAMEQLSTKASVKSIDWVDWSFNVSFLVKDTFTQQPLEGALVTFKGIERLTNSAGIADFGRLGVLDEEDFTVNAEGYNEAGWTLEITEDTMVEVMLLGPLNLNENLSASAQVLGITWEEVLDPAVMMRVYSSYEDFPVYGINGMVVSNDVRTGNGLVWIGKGVSSNQDVQCDVWYETGEEARANIILRSSVNMGSIDGYHCGYIDGFGIYMGKLVDGVHTWIGNAAKSVQPNMWYTARFSAEGSTLRYKIWERGTVEPSAWDLVVSDSSISEGFAGINGGHADPERSCKWDNFILNGSLETFNTIENGSVSGWDILRDVSSVWHFEANEELVGYDRVYDAVPNASITFGEQSALSNSEGLARFEDIPYDTMQPFEITHPDYQGITKGEVFVPELDGEEDFWVNVKIQDLPIEPYKESLSTSAQVTGIDWEDMRYDVTFIIKDYKTGNVIENVEVDLAGRKAYTDSNGIAIFNLVTPTPTIPSYDVYLRHVDYEEDTYYNLVIGGHDTVKQVTIPLQIGLKSNPFSTKPETLSVSAGVTGILWIEV